MDITWPGVDDSWPLVGRDHELEIIQSAYAGAGGAVLLGERGVGKTRLAYEAVTRLARHGCVISMATGSPAAVPLGAFAHLIERDEKNDEKKNGPQLDAFGSLLARFTGGSGPRPVLAVDDAHLLDETSAALVYQVAAGGRGFVLLTACKRAPAPDAVTAVWLRDAAVRIDVPPLPDEQMTRLVTSVLEGPVDGLSRRRLCRLCGGNPLLLRELLRAGEQTGTLIRIDGVWRWSGRTYLTDRLVDVVRAHLGSLEPGLLALIEIVAHGEPLAVSLAEHLTSEELVIAAERAGLVTVERSGSRFRVRVTQPLFADVVRASMPLSRQREIWSSLAKAAESTPQRREDDRTTVTQWRHLGGLDTTPQSLLKAAERARRRLDLGLAVRLATDAERAGAGMPARLFLIEVLIETGRHAEAAAMLPQSAEKPGDELADGFDQDARGRWLVVRQQLRHLDTGSLETVRDVSTAGWPDVPSVQATRAWMLAFEGHNVEAWKIAQQVLQASAVPPDAAIQAAAAATLAAGFLGRYDDVTEVLWPGLALATEHAAAHPWGATAIAGSGCLALLVTGRLCEARQLADRGYGDAVGLASVLGPHAKCLVGVWAALRGIVARSQGRIETALADLTEGAALLEGWSGFPLRRVQHAELAAAHALAGQPDAAARRLGEITRADEPPTPLLDAWVERARAWVSVAEGHFSRAAAQAERAAELARQTQQPTIEALARYDAVRFGGPPRAGARLDELAAELYAPPISAMATVAHGLRGAGDGHAMDRAAHTLADHGHLLYAAEAAAVAHHYHTSAGRVSSGQASLSQVAALRQDCGGALRTPILGPAHPRSLLTARELEVASLAAAGYSAPRIAADLSLSPRTVNNYLGRVYNKLGINGRSQLHELLSGSQRG